ncbi:hypothetical protein [Intestinibacter sp.]
MSKKQQLDDLILGVLFLALVYFLCQCVFDDYDNTIIHKTLVQKGISQKIDELEKKSNIDWQY